MNSRLNAPPPHSNGQAGAPTTPDAPAGAATAPPPLVPLLLDLAQLAQLLSVSEPTVKRLAKDGTLPPGAVVHLGRRRLFSRPIIDRWCADGCPSHARASKRSRR